MSPGRKLRDGLRFAWGLSKGIRRGDLFPSAGRAPIGHAPGGSEEAGRPGGAWERLRDEVAWFTESHHVVPVVGLERPVRILHLTDVHLRDEGPWLDRLEVALSALDRPDLVAITGDVVTRGWTEPAVARFLDALPGAPLGRFSIMGNWEYWSGAEPGPWSALLEAHGVRLLRNEGLALGPIDLYGTDDALAGEPRPRPAGPARAPRVVLTHSPALFDRIAHPDTALVLAGHSHAGQVRLPMLGAAWVPMGTGRYVGGWYQSGTTWLFVGRGIGWSIAPLRLWCPPEMAWIELVPA